MKHLVTSMCILIATPSAALADNAISGIWGGFGVQDNGSSWTIKMSMSEGNYNIDYPSIPCGGYLKLVSKNGNEYTFNEKITKHKKNCTDNGKLVITIADASTLNWKWYYPSGKAGVSTKVKKYSSLQEFNEKVPPLLAEYRKKQKKYSNNDAEALGAALGAAAVLGGLYWLFSGGDDSSSSSYSGGASSYSPKYGCKFCCEGEWGSCRSNTIQVNTPYTNSADAQDYVRKQYEGMCKKYPFYSGGGGSASVSFPNCETYYYND